MRLGIKKRNDGYLLFILPAFILFTTFFIVPFLLSIFTSMTDAYGYNKNINFNFPANYTKAISDAQFSTSLLVTLKYTLFVAIGGNIVSLLLALVLDTDIKGKKILRTIFFLPNLISLIITGFVWTFIYGQVYRSFVSALGSPEFLQISWLGDQTLAIFSIGITAIWQSAGYAMIIYIAALQSIPNELVEAAKVDGAGPFKVLWKIKLPLLVPVIIINIILSVTTCFKAFDFPLAMTTGGPAGATTTLALHIYLTAFRKNMTGYATAMSVIMFVMIAAVTIGLRWYQNRKEGKLS